MSVYKKIARLTLSPTSYINEGYNAICFSSQFSKQEKKVICDLLNFLGRIMEVEEIKLDAYCIISEILSNNLLNKLHEIQDFALQIGLNKKECQQVIKNTLISEIHLFYNPKLTNDEKK